MKIIFHRLTVLLVAWSVLSNEHRPPWNRYSPSDFHYHLAQHRSNLTEVSLVAACEMKTSRNTLLVFILWARLLTTRISTTHRIRSSKTTATIMPTFIKIPSKSFVRSALAHFRTNYQSFWWKWFSRTRLAVGFREALWIFRNEIKLNSIKQNESWYFPFSLKCKWIMPESKPQSK